MVYAVDLHDAPTDTIEALVSSPISAQQQKGVVMGFSPVPLVPLLSLAHHVSYRAAYLSVVTMSERGLRHGLRQRDPAWTLSATLNVPM